jgi:predicted short-subunit dehydrogenase-like oxidoreductase (DUF2520 family)
MRELERDHIPLENALLAIVGPGRVGASLASAAERADLEVVRVRRGDGGGCTGADAALLCVPDQSISDACAALGVTPPPLVGHVSGSTTLEALSAAAELGSATFSIHPLHTFPDGRTGTTGVPCAIAGSDERATAFAAGLARRLEMRPFELPEESRAAYHAAASIASNLLVALEETAADLLTRAGIEEARELLAPLVLRTAANWADRGAGALTGPIARGDAATVERHRAAIRETAPELLAAYDALAERARALAAEVPA